MTIADNVLHVSKAIKDASRVISIREQQVPDSFVYPKEAAIRNVDIHMNTRLGTSLAGGITAEWLSSMSKYCYDSAGSQKGRSIDVNNAKESYMGAGLMELSDVLESAGSRLIQSDKADCKEFASKMIVACLAKATGDKIPHVDKAHMSGARMLVEIASEAKPTVQYEAEFAENLGKHKLENRTLESSLSLG